MSETIWLDSVLLLERDGIPRRHDEATREFAGTATLYVTAVAARLAASFAAFIRSPFFPTQTLHSLESKVNTAATADSAHDDKCDAW